ncbi:MAG: HU family DNA-binding protein [Prevotella sp.]|jgi:predicted histone-like DNA-binding protein|nr:HU family DNA-binding protein [Prevotella sp.]
MPIFFNKVERGLPADPSAPKQWYPVLKSTGLVREREVAKLLADETTLNPKEAEMAVSQLLKVVTNLLLNGNTVQLGNLGSFRLTANTEGSATEAEVSAAKIKKLNVRFSESEELKEAIKKATFKDAASLSSK